MLCAICDKPIDINNAMRLVHPVYCKLVLVCMDDRYCKSKYDVASPALVVRKPKDKSKGKIKHQNRQKFRVGG